MKFEEWAKERGFDGNTYYNKVALETAWNTATAEVKKDHFKIGEEVERKAPACSGGGEIESGWEKSKIVACSASYCSFCGGNVRRIPAWEPKDGEAVLFNRDGEAQSGVYFSGKVFAGRWFVVDAELKPWNQDCIGESWDEV